MPPPAPLVIGRDADLENLKRRLGVGGGERRPRTVVRGWPGVGKTTLLNALAHDADVASSFPDGLLWASAGQEPDPVAELGRWGSSLAAAVQPPRDLADAMARMRASCRRWPTCCG